jgi:hypothetical protein
MDKYTKQEMDEFDKGHCKYSPDSEIWNAITFLDENDYAEDRSNVAQQYLLGIYRGILVGQNGAWSKKAKRALWEEMSKFAALVEGGEVKVTEWRIKDTQRQIDDSKKRITSYKQEVEKLGRQLKELKAAA